MATEEVLSEPKIKLPEISDITSRLDEVIAFELVLAANNYASALPDDIREQIISNIPKCLEKLIDEEAVYTDAINYWQEITPDAQTP